MHIAHTPIFASSLIVPLSLFGTAAFAVTALILLLIAGLFTGVWKKALLKLGRVGSSFAPSNLVSDDSEMRLKGITSALENNSIRDPLTGLYNRRHFFVEFEMEWTMAVRDGHRLSVLMIDIDDFQQLTETGGQPNSDRLLRQVAHCIGKYNLRKEHKAARTGPAEFALILPGANLADSREVAESIRARIPRILLPGNGVPAPLVTVSIGGSCCVPQYRSSPAKMLHEAGLALNEARSQGPNHVWFESASDQRDSDQTRSRPERTHSSPPKSRLARSR